MVRGRWRCRSSIAFSARKRGSLDRLTSAQVQAFYNRLRKAGTGAPTIRRCHAFLRRLLRDAVRWRYVGSNVADADLVDRPKIAKPKKRSFTQDEARRFVAALRADPLEPLYLLAIANAMRQGEILALHWSDIDWDAGEITVRRSLTRIAGKGLTEKATKNETSERVLPLTETVLEALRRHQARQIARRLSAHPNWQDNDLIFCDEHGRPLRRWSVYKNCYLPLLARAGVPKITFHELRHSAATLLLRLGEQPHVVQEILGHSDVSTTLGIYGHVSHEDKRHALENLEAVLSRGDGPDCGKLREQSAAQEDGNGKVGKRPQKPASGGA